MSGQLQEVRTRIASVNSTQQITKAMKMVSAAKLRKAQEAIQRMRPYSLKLSEILTNIVSSLEGELEIDFAKEREINNVLVILITSNRGLCGGFNSNLIKTTRGLIEDKYKDNNVEVMCLGTKGQAYFNKTSNKVIDDFVEIFNALTFEHVAEAANYVMQAFSEGKYDKVELVYSQFKNAATQIFTAEQFLPITKLDDDESTAATSSNSVYLFEPGKEAIIENLLPKILKTQLFKALLDSAASEHGARMTAMDNATENANDLLKELRISYNRARQAAITTELTEIVSGAAALEGA